MNGLGSSLFTLYPNVEIATVSTLFYGVMAVGNKKNMRGGGILDLKIRKLCKIVLLHLTEAFSDIIFLKASTALKVTYYPCGRTTLI